MTGDTAISIRRSINVLLIFTILHSLFFFASLVAIPPYISMHFSENPRSAMELMRRSRSLSPATSL